MDAIVKTSICQASGFEMTTDLGKYLDVPILHEKISRRTFQFIIDKVDNRGVRIGPARRADPFGPCFRPGWAR